MNWGFGKVKFSEFADVIDCGLESGKVPPLHTTYSERASSQMIPEKVIAKDSDSFGSYGGPKSKIATKMGFFQCIC